MTVHKVTKEWLNVTTAWLPAGTGSQDWQETKCQIHVSSQRIVVRVRQVGWLVDILQWLRVLFSAKCVSTGQKNVVVGTRTSEFVIVVLSMCTTSSHHQLAGYATVETVCQVNFGQVFCF